MIITIQLLFCYQKKWSGFCLTSLGSSAGPE